MPELPDNALDLEKLPPPVAATGGEADRRARCRIGGGRLAVRAPGRLPMPGRRRHIDGSPRSSAR